MSKHRKLFRMLGVEKLRRNEIVMEKSYSGGFIFYGRVNRRIDEDHVEVIDGGKYVTIYADQDLERVEGYKGRWDSYGPVREKYPVFYPMSSLRRLKQRASRYNPKVWKKNRK